MAITIENYLKDLVNQKNALVSTLQECGVEAGVEEKFNTLVPKVAEVYEAGKAEGGSYNEGYEAGKQAEYDRFWDNFQQNGNRTDYRNGFGRGWTAETFKPKYDIRPTDAYMMFYNTDLGGIDLAEHLNSLGVTIDFSNCKNMQWIFERARISRVGVIDITGAVAANTIFANCSLLHTIDTLIVSENSTAVTNSFGGCTSLANITIEGIIAQNANFKDCPLTHDSLMSIINALKNFVEKKTLRYPSGSIKEVNWGLGDYRGCNFCVTNAAYSNNTLTLDCYYDYNPEIGNFTVILNIENFDEDVSNIKEIGFHFVDETYEVWEAQLTLEGATESRTLTLGVTNLAKLTDSEKAIATKKGWTLA